MKIYIAEFRKDKSFLSKMISFFTKSNYTHTAMYMQTTKTIGYLCELTPTRDKGVFDKSIPDYHVIKYKNINDFKTKINKTDKRIIDMFEVPIKVTPTQSKKVISWWKKKEGKSYGYFRLISNMFLMPLYWGMKAYVKLFKKPFPQLFIFDKGSNVCSTAVDECFKSVLKHDIFPNYPERVAYPGLFAKKLKKFKV